MTVTGSALKLDYAKAQSEIVAFIKKTVEEAGAKGVVVGLSGGVDSAVVGALCVKALGKGRVVALLMPSGSTPREDVQDATALAESWGVRFFNADVSHAAERILSAIDLEGDRVAKGNVHARTRMTISYYLANVLNLLVAGTGDRSEDLLGYFCYDDKTRVVTTDGPKGIDELAVGDRVFSLDPLTRDLLEAPVQEVSRFDYNGKMVQFKSRSVDLLVTPNHRMLIQKSTSSPGSRLVFRTAEECLGLKATVTPLPSGWNGNGPKPDAIEVIFSQRHVQRAIRMTIEDAFYLFGLFIGDGSAVRLKTTVPVKSLLTKPEFASAYRDKGGRFVTLKDEDDEPQMKTYDTFETVFSLPGYTKPDARMRLVEILDKYGIGHSYTRNTVRVPSKGIYELFVQFGVGAKNKRIPRWILSYPSHSLAHLLRGLKDSDGSHADNQNVYYTSSEKLKDDFVQLCFKLGRRATVRMRGERRPMINGKTIKTGPAYEISFQGKQHHQHIIDNQLAGLVEYKGRVWCPSVPPYENILVERNGRYIFSGNTKYGDGGVDFLPIAHLYKTQVRGLAAHLGLPERVVKKPSSPRLWPGHLAADELPAEYDALDVVLYCLFDERMSPARAAAESGVGRGIVDAVLKKYRGSAHKRAYPPMVRPW